MNAKAKWCLKFIPYILLPKYGQLNTPFISFIHWFEKQTNKKAAILRNSASHDTRPVYFKDQPCRMHPVLWKKKKDLTNFIQAKCSSLNLCKCSLTSSHGLVFHSGHSFRLHRVVACGFVISLQLKSLSLHSTDRILIPEPQLTEHCKRNNQQWWKPGILHKKERQKLTKPALLIRNY